MCAANIKEGFSRQRKNKLKKQKKQIPQFVAQGATIILSVYEEYDK